MFAERRKRFLDAMGPNSIAILIGHRLATRSSDTEYPFRQDSDFWYLTGFNHPDAIAVLRTDGGPTYTLFVQPRDPAAETWTGLRPGVEGAVEQYGADAAHSCQEILDQLAELVRGRDRIYHALGRRPDIDAALIQHQESMRRQSRAGVAPAREILDPRDIVHEMRLFKSDAELAIMRRAAAISLEAHERAAALAWEGRFEYEIEAELAYVFRRRGGSGPAYGSIVAGGSGATILHYVSNDRQLVNGDLLLIDAGVELEGYASDVTRTYPVGGSFAGERRAVYEAVLDAQLAALEALRPGTTLPEIHSLTIRNLSTAMVELGLLEGSVDSIIEEERYKRYYMHGTSHWLGLDVHDAGSYAHGDVPRKLEAGMTFTVEPGLYIPRDDTEVPEAFRGIGVRIEDNVAVHQERVENITEAIPKQPRELEAWVRAGRP